MIVGVPRESLPNERRVALVPESVRRLVAKNVSVLVQSQAGQGAWFADDDYRSAGATIAACAADLFAQSDLIAKIRAPTLEEVEQMRRSAAIVCPLYPERDLEVARRLASGGITAIALENLPRTTIAQAMDVLSSQSTVAGYRAVIRAANALAKFFPMLMTPAGTIAPARVLVLGAGVAGLQAIATARRLGAVVQAFDVRPAVRQEVESLGAKFIASAVFEDAATAEGYARQLTEETLRRVRAVIQPALANSDVCICSALVPKERAPILVTREMVRSMRPGSVIVDLAGEQGGNCELTEAGKDLCFQGVAILAPLHLPSEMAMDASRMYSRNMEKIILHFFRDGILRFDFRDPITERCIVAHDGEIIAPELRQALTALRRG
jgi:NAD(P) transhydrogenase subunit alpha